jgi:GT2 family glycosyltransferase
MPSQKLVSVIVINFNGKEFLPRLLHSLLKTDYKEFEVIFVDNASRDGSVEYVRENFKDERIFIIENDRNYGPAAARNIGFSKARGEYIAFLDNDTEVDSQWLTELVKVFEGDSKIAVAQCKLLDMVERNRFDYAGDYLTPLGFLAERARSAKDTGQFDYICDILSGKSAAMMMCSDIIKKIGGFDGDYFILLEDTDIFWRAWLAGYRSVFIPRAIVYHAFGTEKKPQQRYYTSFMIRYYGCRNYMITLIKNLGIINLIYILPIQMISIFMVGIMFLIHLQFEDSKWIFRALAWILGHPVYLSEKRRITQNLRVVTDTILMQKLMVKKPFKYYIGKALSYISRKPY